MGQLHDLRFLCVHHNAKFVANPANLFEAMPQVFLGWVNQVSIIHISPIPPDPEHLLHIVIQTVGGGKRLYLAYLAAQSQTFITKHANHLHSDTLYFIV